MMHEVPEASPLVGKLEKVAPRVKFDVRVDTGLDRKYQKEEIKRLKSHAAMLENEIKNFDPEKQARRALAALKAELTSKRARLMEYGDA